MTHSADLYLFGNPRNTDSADSNPRIRFHFGAEIPAQQATSEQLNRLAGESRAEHVGFQNASHPLSATVLDRALSLLKEQRETTAVLITQKSPSSPFGFFNDLPLSLALLIEPPETGGTLLFRKSAFGTENPFSGSSNPIWQRLIQRSQESIAVICSETSVSEEVSEDAVNLLPELAPQSPGREKDWLLAHLENLQPEQLVSPIRSGADATAVIAGLLQIHDYLDASHTVSQSIEGEGRSVAGDYWHGIMHRREPDDSNAKYWFRRVGEHPIFGSLAEAAGEIFRSSPNPELESWSARCLGDKGWDPSAFIDFCSEGRRAKNAGLGVIARRIQWVEMLLLLKQTYEDAST